MRVKHIAESPMRVLLVDDHRPVREVMARLLGAEPDISVVGEAGTGPEAIAMARRLSPDIVLITVRLALLSGVDATRTIVAECPSTCVIGMTLVDNPAESEAIRNAGARACVSKTLEVEGLFTVVREVHARQLSEAHAGGEPCHSS